MQQRLAAADGDGGGAQRTQLVDALEHLVEGNRLGEIVEFVAVSARQIAAPHGNDVRQKRMVSRNHGTHNFAGPAQIAVEAL